MEILEAGVSVIIFYIRRNRKSWNVKWFRRIKTFKEERAFTSSLKHDFKSSTRGRFASHEVTKLVNLFFSWIVRPWASFPTHPSPKQISLTSVHEEHFERVGHEEAWVAVLIHDVINVLLGVVEDGMTRVVHFLINQLSRLVIDAHLQVSGITVSNHVASTALWDGAMLGKILVKIWLWELPCIDS